MRALDEMADELDALAPIEVTDTPFDEVRARERGDEESIVRLPCDFLSHWVESVSGCSSVSQRILSRKRGGTPSMLAAAALAMREQPQEAH